MRALRASEGGGDESARVSGEGRISQLTESRCPPGGWQALPRRRSRPRAPWADRCGWSRRRSMPAAAARPAASRWPGTSRRCAPPPRPCSARTWSHRRPAPRACPSARCTSRRGSQIAREIYLSLTLNRERGRIALIASAAGGMDIEEVAHKTPEKILAATIHPAAGLQALPGARAGLRPRPQRHADHRVPGPGGRALPAVHREGR